MRTVVVSDRCPDQEDAVTRYGLLAEFTRAEELVEACRKTRAAGYEQFDAYSPFPIKGLITAMGAAEDTIQWVVFWGGVAGGVGGFGALTYLVVWAFPLNIGGRPLFDWPAFVPITFELTILCAALAGLVGFMFLNALPMPYHPVLHVPGFHRATSDRFYLCIEARDPRFEARKTREFLEGLGAEGVQEVGERL